MPMSILAASTIGLVWVQFVKSNLRVVAAEATFLATQADTTIAEVESFVVAQMAERIKVPLSKLDVRVAQGLAGVELGIEPLELVGLGGILVPSVSVRCHGALEL
jgi:hypothetical protein